jgi:Leucine-rich repeat (LRR) protein
MKYAFLLCSIFLITTVAKAQLLDSLSLDTLSPFTAIAGASKNPDAVIKLTLKKQKLKSFPEEIRMFKNLQYIDLSHNRIQRIPDWIGELTRLQFIILSHNDIDSIPSGFFLLQNLKYFIMNRDGLKALPAETGNLSQLVYLDLWGDNIASFPTTLSKLHDLRQLDLRDILISAGEQERIKAMLPDTKIYFSPSCQCAN